jgi:hypothetical protein
MSTYNKTKGGGQVAKKDDDIDNISERDDEDNDELPGQKDIKI